MSDPEPLPDDESVLDELFDEAFEAERSWRTLDAARLRALLGKRAGALAGLPSVLELAREHARQAKSALPVIPGYVVVAEIGRGAMGHVYRAHDPALGRQVALKVLPAALASSMRARQRFVLEARAMARVNHAHVVPVYAVVEQGEACAYAMELVHGTTLARRIAEAAAAGAPLSVAQVCRQGMHLASALAAVHEAGLLHRDIKPGNVLLRADGSALLADFGLVHDDTAGMQTKGGELVGTPAYASPEQLRGEPLDARSDIYALGVTLYEALTTQLPHTARSPEQRLLAIARGETRALRGLRRDVPRDLEVVVHKAMEALPADRYVTAAELANDLLRVIELRPIRAQPPSLLARAGKFARRQRTSVAAVLLTTVVLLAGFLLLLRELAWRADLPARFATQLREARLALLRPESNSWMYRIAEPGAASGFLLSGTSAWLLPAVAAYDRLTSFGPLSPAIASERRTVALADALLRRVDNGNGAPAHLEPLIAAFLANSTTGVTAWSPTTAIEALPVGERRTLGLLAYCLSHVQGAVQSWQGLDLDLEQPDALIDAALGQILLYQGTPAGAYPRLLRAVDAFPAAGFLHLALADAALACGDRSAARRFHAAARTKSLHDSDASLERQAVELLLASNDAAAARAHVERLDGRLWLGNPVLGRRYAEALARTGDLEQALQVLHRVRTGWPRSGPFDSIALPLLTSWWQAGSCQQRLAALRAVTGCGPAMPRLAAWLEALAAHPSRQSNEVPPLLQLAAQWRRVVRCTWRTAEELMRPLLRRLVWLRRLLLVGPVLPILAPGGATAQMPPSWTQRQPTTSPAARYLHGMVHDAARARTVVFGGATDPGYSVFRSDTWEWDGTNWTQSAPAHSPSPRVPGNIAYDSTRAKVVLFGGVSTFGSRFGDTWEYDGVDWLQRQPLNAPSPRFANLAFDSTRGVTVLFGGSGPGDVIHGDTWEWDGVNWLQRSPLNSPPPTAEQGMAFDAARHRLVMFSGYVTSNPWTTTDTTWEYDGTTWSLIPTPQPPTPNFTVTAMVWHPGMQRVVYGFLPEMCGWSWDSSRWRRQCATNTPSNRSFVGASYEVASNRIVVFGGFSTVALSETWEYDVGSPPDANATSFGSGCVGSLGVPNLQSLAPPLLGSTWNAQMTSIPAGLALFAFGWSNTQWGAAPLPFPLAPFGLGASCIGYTSVDVLEVVLHAGTADYSLPIPCVPNLYGFQMYVQGFSLDPALTTPIQLAGSNALHVTLGG